MTVTSAEFVAAARAWDGTRWKHQGRNRHGVDCVGLIVVAMRGLGLSDYDSTAYGREPDPHRFLAHFPAAGGVRVPLGQAVPGDVLIIRGMGPYPCHVGILTEFRGGRGVLHAHATNRKVMEETMTPELHSLLVAAYRVPGVVPA